MTESRRSWTVLVVDDSQEFLDTACSWISSLPRFEVVGTARDGAHALERVAGLQPDLVLMDAVMPVIDGFEATRILRQNDDSRWVVIVSFHDSEAVRREAWAAGADGFISKADFVGSLQSIVRHLDPETEKPGEEDLFQRLFMSDLTRKPAGADPAFDITGDSDRPSTSPSDKQNTEG
jgi:CheY-like chemotaxis protein